MKHPFLDLAPGYERILATMTVDPSRLREIDAAVDRLADDRHLPLYLREEALTNVPSAFLACLDEREDGADLSRALGQGDRWDRVSRNVPRGKGPFASKLEADVFYIRWDHLGDNTQPWSWPYICWKGEGWNGWGPRDYHRINTGYLWAGTNHYGRAPNVGKYVKDGKWDGTVEDEQLGLIPVLKRLVERVPALATFGAFPAHVDAPPIVPAPSPPGVGNGQLHDVRWLQDALNKVYLDPRRMDPLLLDGNFGRRTRTALWQYQASAGLVSDGIYGPRTDAQLQHDLGDLPP